MAKKKYIGIDLGGTFIKGGVVDGNGNILYQDKLPTQSDKGAEQVSQNIATLCEKVLAGAGVDKADIVGIGMGVPGMIEPQKGVVVFANNLGWENFAVGERVERLTGLKVKLANDANAAALGENKFGSGKAYDDTVFITLGTGVGGGIVIDGKLFEGYRGAGAELGHAVILAGGEPCSCGRKGCWEAYASATALIRDTKRAMKNNPKSKLWEVGGLDKVDGKTAFDYKAVDADAKAVVDNYLEKLSVGLVNLANELRPQAIILGGGVCAQGDELVKPLQQKMNEEIYAGPRGPEVKIMTASLGNSAGLLGAAALWM